jgi:hypothetical protein
VLVLPVQHCLVLPRVARSTFERLWKRRLSLPSSSLKCQCKDILKSSTISTALFTSNILRSNFDIVMLTKLCIQAFQNDGGKYARLTTHIQGSRSCTGQFVEGTNGYTVIRLPSSGIVASLQSRVFLIYSSSSNPKTL